MTSQKEMWGNVIKIQLINGLKQRLLPHSVDSLLVVSTEWLKSVGLSSPNTSFCLHPMNTKRQPLRSWHDEIKIQSVLLPGCSFCHQCSLKCSECNNLYMNLIFILISFLCLPRRHSIARRLVWSFVLFSVFFLWRSSGLEYNSHFIFRFTPNCKYQLIIYSCQSRSDGSRVFCCGWGGQRDAVCDTHLHFNNISDLLSQDVDRPEEETRLEISMSVTESINLQSLQLLVCLTSLAPLPSTLGNIQKLFQSRENLMRKLNSPFSLSFFFVF